MLGVRDTHNSAAAFIKKYELFIQEYPGKIDVKLSHHTDIIEDKSQANAVKRSGNMANKTTKSKISRGRNKGYEVRGHAKYTIYVHEGKGTSRKYGPRRYIKDAFDAELPKIKKFTLKEIGL